MTLTHCSPSAGSSPIGVRLNCFQKLLAHVRYGRAWAMESEIHPSLPNITTASTSSPPRPAAARCYRPGDPRAACALCAGTRARKQIPPGGSAGQDTDARDGTGPVRAAVHAGAPAWLTRTSTAARARFPPRPLITRRGRAHMEPSVLNHPRIAEIVDTLVAAGEDASPMTPVAADGKCLSPQGLSWRPRPAPR